MCEAKYSCSSLTCWHGAINLQDSRIEQWYIKLKFQLERHTLISEYPYNLFTIKQSISKKDRRCLFYNPYV